MLTHTTKGFCFVYLFIWLAQVLVAAVKTDLQCYKQDLYL